MKNKKEILPIQLHISKSTSESTWSREEIYEDPRPEIEEPEPEIVFRKATPADIDRLRRWDEEPHVVASNPNDPWDWEDDLSLDPDWREQLIAELDGRPIGFVQIMDPAGDESRYWGEVRESVRAIDIWIGEPDCIGRGYGTMMMRRALDRCFADESVTEVWIDPLASHTRVHRFYERLGFEFVEYRRFGDDDCKVYRLRRPPG